ncbi:hypothetical protein EHF_0731 [Ehrlichia japonica]|uniref:Uncharacterized protein n=1 Tax=Ehrlichia japonica TaxID=391036 RepID=X5GBZ9_9RICK|nr:hypothetical protein EHF_0731 [Ehrlichia japonica]
MIIKKLPTVYSTTKFCGTIKFNSIFIYCTTDINPHTINFKLPTSTTNVFPIYKLLTIIELSFPLSVL